jgi:hypothetical protein
MIHYAITHDDLRTQIEAEKPGWLARAAAAEPADALWGEIKAVFLRLQNDKCLYCELKLEGGPLGKRIWDVEHYRPKGRVRAWPLGAKADYGIVCGDAFDDGYALLAHEERNYAATCKVCNSGLKSDYFPVRQARRFNTNDYDELALEEAHLLFPLGAWGDSPDGYIVFQGMIPVPVAAPGSGRAYERAKVTIDFFKLAAGREILRRERAKVITDLYDELLLLDSAVEEARKERARERIAEACDPATAHSACAMDFLRVCGEDPALAKQYFELAWEYRRSRNI